MLDRQIRKYRLSELQAGMIVAELMASDDGKSILGAGSILTDNRIRLLQHWGVDRVAVLVDPPKVGTATVLPWSFDREVFNQYYKDTVDLVKTAFKTISLFREVPVSRMQELANEKIDPLIDAPGVMNHLLMIRHTDDYTFEHSVNVAILSGIIGRWMGVAGQDLRDLIFSGLMHDIGKSQVPLEILDKPGKLTPDEMDIMRRHTTQGYFLLKEVPQVPTVVMLAVLEHHERMDGSGYPLRLKGTDIHKFARIIAVADIYDAMTSDRVYRRRTTPYHVIANLFEQMFAWLDPEVCSTFLYNVRDFFIGNRIMLSDGRQAEVIRPGSYPAGLPLVRTMDGCFINLEQKRDIKIHGLISA